jgi:hypothetical protein
LPSGGKELRSELSKEDEIHYREQTYVNETRGKTTATHRLCSVTPAVGGYDGLWHADAQKIHFNYLISIVLHHRIAIKI